MRRVPETTAEAENFRSVPAFPARPELANITTVKRDPVEPVPVGTYVAMVFRVTGYDRDCDGSLMARLAHVDRAGEESGWEPDHLGIDPDSEVVLDDPGELHRLATPPLGGNGG
jgi:hypothetical protein